MTYKIEDVLKLAKKDGRICPQPMKWKELWELLPNKQQKPSGGWEPALPLILSAWQEPHIMKILRFQEHIEWANKHNVLDKVIKFLNDLKEEDWYYGK